MSLIRRYPLVEFFGLAYALSWILESPLAYAPALPLQDSAYSYRAWITVNKPLYTPLLP